MVHEFYVFLLLSAHLLARDRMESLEELLCYVICGASSISQFHHDIIVVKPVQYSIEGTLDFYGCQFADAVRTCFNTLLKRVLSLSNLSAVFSSDVRNSFVLCVKHAS